MVASQAALEETPVSVALQMAEQMEALAAAGDWEHIEKILSRLPGVIMDLPEAERRSVLLAVKRSTDKVTSSASNTRRTVSGKIAELRRGQVAKKAYELR